MAIDRIRRQHDGSGRTHDAPKANAQAARQGAALSPRALAQLANDPHSASPRQVMRLQRTIGNRLTQRLLAGAVQRQAEVGPEGGAVDADVQSKIDSARGGGRPLDETVGGQVGHALGADFSGVRVHTDPGADQLNRSLSAQAFTVGSDIFFSQGKYNPGSAGGKQLLAHELTHVVQQGGAAPTGQRKANTVQTKLTVGPSGDKYEQEAESVARSVTAPGLADRGLMLERDRGLSVARQPVVQRLAYDDPPSSWAPLTKIKRSGEGVQGVFFFTKGTDRIVVKPEQSDLGNVEFANRFLSQGMGFEAPKIKSYPKTSRPGRTIANYMTTGPVEGARTDTEVQEQLDNANHIAVMSMVKGTSIQSLEDDDAEEFVTNATALQQVGRLMVSDAFLGNSDRLVGGTVNLGNFFYQTATLLGAHVGQVATIDNAAGFQKYQLSHHGNLTGPLEAKMNLIEMLIDPGQRLGWITQFYNKLKQVYRGKPKALNAVNTGKDFITDNVSQGIDAGLADMANVFTTNMALVQQLHSIRKDYGRTKDKNYGAAKGLAKYIKARMTGGDDPATATAKLKSYVEYRAKRRSTPRGFKWITKLFTPQRGF